MGTLIRAWFNERALLESAFHPFFLTPSIRKEHENDMEVTNINLTLVLLVMVTLRELKSKF